MTHDMVALTRGAPDVRAIVSDMLAAGEELRVNEVADGAVTQLCDDEGRPLVSIEAPLLVQVPGEVERLLDSQAAARVETPVWWVEVRASAAHGESTRIAWRFTDEVVRRLGGVVWSPGPADVTDTGAGGTPAVSPTGREPASREPVRPSQPSTGEENPR